MRKEWFDDFFQSAAQFRAAAGERSHRLTEDDLQFPDERRRHGDSSEHAESFEFTALAGLDVEQHDDKQKKHHDGAGIDQNLDDRDKQGLQQEEKPGHKYK